MYIRLVCCLAYITLVIFTGNLQIKYPGSYLDRGDPSSYSLLTVEGPW